MAPLPDYVTGTITLTNGSPNFTGDGTGWLAAGFREGDTILGIEDNEGVVYVIESITDNDAGTLTQDWQGATGTYAYRMRYLSDGQRVTAQARQLIELLGNGNLQAVAGLPGTPQTLIMFTGPGAMVEVPRTDLVSGAAYDVQVDTLADRDAYDSADAGFAVLVANVGDGRAAIYSKLSGAVGDWSDPAYVTGGSIDVTVGSVTELDYGEAPTITGTPGPGTLELDFGLPGGPELSIGSVTRGDADVTSTPVTGGYELDFTIPSQVAQGDYSGATSYVTGDVVQYQGSSWIALQATTGNTPPSLPTTNNAYWQLLARAGNDGAGTVTTVIAGDGIFVDSTDPTEPVVSLGESATVTALLDVVVGDSGSGGTKGLVPAPEAGDAAAGKFLAADGTWQVVEQGGYDPNIAMLALEVADLKGVRLGMAGGIADPFDSEDGIDTGGSSNQVYNSASDLYSPSTSGGVDVIPTMTGSTTSGVTISTTTSSSTFFGWRAADNDTGTFWETSNPFVSGEFWQVDFGSGNAETVAAYTITPRPTFSARAPQAWTLQGSNDGSGWTTIDTRSAQSSWGDAMRTFNLSSPQTYRYFKLVFTAINSGGVPMDIAEIELLDPTSINDMTLLSVAYTAASEPETVRAALQVVENEAVTVNTDFTMEVSRDGGSTWTEADLALVATTESVKLYEDPEIDVSGQPSGTSMKWRAKTLNNKNISFSGVVEQWL